MLAIIIAMYMPRQAPVRPQRLSRWRTRASSWGPWPPARPAPPDTTNLRARNLRQSGDPIPSRPIGKGAPNPKRRQRARTCPFVSRARRKFRSRVPLSSSPSPRGGSDAHSCARESSDNFWGTPRTFNLAQQHSNEQNLTPHEPLNNYCVVVY